MITPTDYLRDRAKRFTDAWLPTQRKLTELGRDGAPWATQSPNGRWVICDPAALDRALGLTEPSPVAA
jgi:hypothetical protein